MKNPFSLLDFLGYVFPGAFLAICVLYFTKMYPLDFVNPMSFSEVLSVFASYLNDTESIVSCTVFLILSYLLGHIIAYVSSITVERFVIWWYGYPSEFLLKEESNGWHFWKDGKSMAKKKNFHFRFTIARTYILRIVVSVCLLPILIPVIFIKLIGGDVFFVKDLDPYLRDIIMEKRKALSLKLKLPDPSHYDKVDYHRVIYHYEYEHTNNHRQKLDNYVALYDFLRSMTLIFTSIFMYIFFVGFFGENSIGQYYFIDLSVLMVLSFLSFMSFFKFYRRFTLEAFMCLVTDPNI